MSSLRVQIFFKMQLSYVLRTQENPSYVRFPIQFVKLMNFSLLIISIVFVFSFVPNYSTHQHSYFRHTLQDTECVYTIYSIDQSSILFVFGLPGCPFLFFSTVGIVGGLRVGCLFFICVYNAAQEPYAFPQLEAGQVKSLGTSSFFRLCIFAMPFVIFFCSDIPKIITQFWQTILHKRQIQRKFFDKELLTFSTSQNQKIQQLKGIVEMNKQPLHKEIFEGNKGKVLLELSKSYKGDDRFKLDDRFKDDLEIQKLPQRFKQVAENGIIEKVAKKKKIIQKQKPLIITRFEPGTAKAQKNLKKAQGIKKFQQNLKKHEQKKKKQSQIQTGVDRVKKAQNILAKNNEEAPQKQSQFRITVNGNRKEAFKPAEFKLFG